MTSLCLSSLRPRAFSSVRDLRPLACRTSTVGRYDRSGWSQIPLLLPLNIDIRAEPVRSAAPLTTSSPTHPTRTPPTSTSILVERKSAASHPCLPYHVHRTAYHELPVYHLAKRGGNLHQTRIRKIEGDVAKLRDELQSTLKLQKEHTVINQITGHIILKVCWSGAQEQSSSWKAVGS